MRDLRVVDPYRQKPTFVVKESARKNDLAVFASASLKSILRVAGCAVGF